MTGEQQTALPSSTGVDAHYSGRLAAGVFEIPQCTDCGKPHFFPRVLCPFCGSDALAWIKPSGRGTVYSTTVVRHKEGEHNVCLVDLDEGPRMMSRVTGMEPGAVRIGMRVSVRIEQDGDTALLVFTAAEPA
jgi:uncharacterized OB-fold protein